MIYIKEVLNFLVRILVKILWGTLMSAGLAIVVNGILNVIEKKIG